MSHLRLLLASALFGTTPPPIGPNTYIRPDLTSIYNRPGGGGYTYVRP